MRRAILLVSGAVLAALLASAAPASADPNPADSARAAAPAPRAPLADLGRGARAFASDAWYVASSPARLDRDGVLWLAGTAAVTAVLMRNDEAITAAFERSQGQPAYDAVLDVGHAIEPVGYMGRTAPFYVGALVVGYATRNRPLTVIPAQILESHLIAGGLRNLGKLLVGRRRPFEGFGPYEFEFDGGTSFPSGHSSVAFELATILSHHADRWPATIALYGLATTIALQRVDSRSHWASDVVVPAVTGTWIARTIVNRHDAREHALALVPALAPSGAPGFKAVLELRAP